MVVIRRCRTGDEPALFEVFFSAIHLVAACDYTAEQVEAWAPRNFDSDLWQKRVRGIKPFVAELEGQIVAYADLQPSGYIDHFFVSGHHPRRGVGSQLMQHILGEADRAGIAVLTSDVSRTAQPFFGRFGFEIVEQRIATIRGVELPNALMRRAA